MKKKSELLKGVALLILGAALIAGGFYILKDKIDFYTHSIKAEGTIINVESNTTRSKTYYHPVVSFQTEDGNTYNFISETGTSSAFDYNTGDKIKIRYYAVKPQVAKLDTFMELWGLPLALLVAGIVILLAGGGIIYTHFAKNKLKNEILRTGALLKLAGRVESKYSKYKTEFVIISEWLNPTDSKIYTFTSNHIAFDPTTYIQDRLIDVWVLPSSPKKDYYMDISFLPNLA